MAVRKTPEEFRRPVLSQPSRFTHLTNQRLLPLGLKDLGFSPEEIFAGGAYSDGRQLVRAETQGEEAWLLLDTKVRLDLSLQLAYVRRRGLSIERDYSPNEYAVCRLTEFSALGKSRPHDVACAFGDEGWDAGNYAGALGMGYIEEHIVGVDCAGPSVALTQRDAVRSSFSRGAYRIPLVPGTLSRLPVTQALGDGHAPTATPAFLLSTGAEQSSISLTYVKEHWTERRLVRRAVRASEGKGTVSLSLVLPDSSIVRLNALVDAEGPEYITDVGVGRIDGVLGIDFLRRWMQVFDFPGAELVLFDY